MSEYVFRTDEPIEDCEECPIATVTNFITWCSLKKCGINKGNSFSCPLVELPPHGRLGDLDKLASKVAEAEEQLNGNDPFMPLSDVHQLISRAPTILESSK